MTTRVSNLPPLPARPESGHKGLFGRILVIGGNHQMIGAPVLAGTAALRCGAGLVQLAIPGEVLPAAISITPELIGIARDGKKSALVDAIDSADAIILGPGLGTDVDSIKLVDLVVKTQKLVVVDADALNALALLKHWPKHARASCVLTPHPGEFKRLGHWIALRELTDEDDVRIDAANRLADATAQTIVLKGHRTVITDGRSVYVNRTGNSALSKAGSGDVLCGVIATLLAQQMSRFDASSAGAWLHGRAGEIASEQFGMRSVLATDVILALPQAIKEYESRFGTHQS